MKVDIYRLGESDDSWAVFVEGCKIDELTGLTREQAIYHRGLIVASYEAGVVELPDTRPDTQTQTEWRDTGSGPGWSGDWGQHDDPEQQP